MRKFIVAVGLVLSLGACKKDKVDGILDELDGWANKMCACKDVACVDKTHEDYKKWENDVMEPAMKGMDEKSISKDKMERGDKADDKRKECRSKIKDAAEATTPPAAAPAP